RILGILPTLLHQPRRRLAMVLYKPILIQIAILIDPVQCQLDARPNRLDELEVAGPPIVGAGKYQVKRRGVHAAVIAPKRYLSQHRHLALSRFMQDFARLGILLRRELFRLRSSEVRKYASRHRWEDPQTLQSRDDPVSSKRRAKPRDSGIGV